LRAYYIFSSGAIKRKDNTILLEKEGEKKFIPIEDVDVIHIFGEVSFNSKLLVFLAQQNKLLHVYNYYGTYSGSFIPHDRNLSGELLVQQVKHYLDPEKRLFLARSFVEGALFHMRRNLREYEGTEEYVRMIEAEWERAKYAPTIPELMGCEGRAREAYYQAFNSFLKEEFFFAKREKRPPSNPINALISFGNSLLYTTMITECYRTQLNPSVSYLHEPRTRRFSLCLDLAEIFKPLIVDPVIFKAINMKILRLSDFDQDINWCYLNDEGKKKFVRLFEEKLATTIRHRKLKRKVSYRTLLRLECYKLIKYLLGDEVYTPFKAWW